MAYASPVDACGPVEPVVHHLGNNTEWIALVRRNLCSFVQKVSTEHCRAVRCLWTYAGCCPPRTPFGHISALIWSGVRGNIARTAL